VTSILTRVCGRLLDQVGSNYAAMLNSFVMHGLILFKFYFGRIDGDILLGIVKFGKIECDRSHEPNDLGFTPAPIEQTSHLIWRHNFADLRFECDLCCVFCVCSALITDGFI
jgi:hypothetical protein